MQREQEGVYLGVKISSMQEVIIRVLEDKYIFCRQGWGNAFQTEGLVGARTYSEA